MNKKVTKYRFVPFEEVLEKRLKSERFRKGYYQELTRLQLVHEIKTLRRQQKMTQEALAKKADMPQSVIARIESGTHSYSLSTLQRIAQVFGKTIGFKEIPKYSTQ